MMCLGWYRKKFKPTIFVSLKYRFPELKGQVQRLYNDIQTVNKTGRKIGLQPYCTDEWNIQREYLAEYNEIPVMLNVMSSDSLAETTWGNLTLEQIEEAIEICNIAYLRFHEIMSYCEGNFPLEYVKDVLKLSLRKKIPVFWNEWDTTKYSSMRKIINDAGAHNVVVSFATNNEYMEPIEGYKLLRQFKHKGASVQSWYWWERNGRQKGYELLMPTDKMRQHTSEAFDADCEVVQYEPMGYFVRDWKPIDTMEEILKKDI